jgi:phage terminase large subunit-like protein
MEALAEAGVPITEYPSSSPARMVPSTAKFFDAVVSGQVAHDHAPALARHLDNCVIKTDQKGPRVVKEHRGSPRKIDAAVAALIAFDRATHRREAEPDALVAQFFSL